jgi:tRNA pseudouridine38-40 synthase
VQARLRTIKLTLAYDGTAYVGWQRQAAGVSIQALVEAALAEIEGAAVDVIGASRTDAGAHALGQIASLRLTHPMDTDTIVRALNAKLPDEVRVLAAAETDASFHARYDARSKTYRYRIATAAILSPFARRYVWHVPGELDDATIERAAHRLEGRHDFAAFQASGSAAATTIRTIQSVHVQRCMSASWPVANSLRDGSVLSLEVTGDGFLRHMVRTVVGTLVEIGAGRRPLSTIDELLTSRDRQLAGQTAPAQGLFLVCVTY